jgi:tryptophan synthase alpha chain
MNRIDNKLAALRAKGEKALALFLTAGYPRIDSTVELVLSLERAGADLVELGMPFSDPIADGPVIQKSSAVALKNGVTLDRILGYVREIRGRSEIPLVLMGYINPILAFGMERFFVKAQRAGVDGVILPEVPYEECSKFRDLFAANRLAQILLVSPTTSPRRIEAIDMRSSGFLYCVSTTGVTGTGNRTPARDYLMTVRRHARKNPVLVGFGVSSRRDAASLASYADGVIIGSALINEIAKRGSQRSLKQWVRGIKSVLR